MVSGAFERIIVEKSAPEAIVEALRNREKELAVMSERHVTLFGGCGLFHDHWNSRRNKTKLVRRSESDRRGLQRPFSGTS